MEVRTACFGASLPTPREEVRDQTPPRLSDGLGVVCSCKVGGRFSKGNIFPLSLENAVLLEREAFMDHRLGLQVFLLPQEVSRELGFFES